MTRRTTPEQRRRLIARYKRSNLTQREFCDREGISVSALQNWLYRRGDVIEETPPRFVEVDRPCVEAIEVRVGSVEARLPVSLGDEPVGRFRVGPGRKDGAMIGLPSHARVLLFSAPTDMRRGHPGLYGLVKAAGEDPYSGDLYVFVSKRRNRAKILTFEAGGFVVWYKRLERGRFRHPRGGERNVELDAVELAMLLDGIDVAQVRRPKHWVPARKTEIGGSTLTP